MQYKNYYDIEYSTRWEVIARWAATCCERGMCRYKYMASDFQSPSKAIVSKATLASKAYDAQPRRKE